LMPSVFTPFLPVGSVMALFLSSVWCDRPRLPGARRASGHRPPRRGGLSWCSSEKDVEPTVVPLYGIPLLHGFACELGVVDRHVAAKVRLHDLVKV
jgi:hypothetical protein